MLLQAPRVERYLMSLRELQFDQARQNEIERGNKVDSLKEAEKRRRRINARSLWYLEMQKQDKKRVMKPFSTTYPSNAVLPPSPILKSTFPPPVPLNSLSLLSTTSIKHPTTYAPAPRDACSKDTRAPA
jgi:hypothetical protein